MSLPHADPDAAVQPEAPRPLTADRVIAIAAAKVSTLAPGIRASSLTWSLAVSIVAQASTFAMSCVLARVLGKTAFGEWAALQSTIGTISGIAQLSMAVTATKFLAQLGRTEPVRAGRILGICSTITMATGLVAALAVGGTAAWFSASVLHAPHLVGAVRVSALSLFLLTISGYQIGALSGLESFRSLAVLGALNGVCTAVLVAGFGWRYGLDGALLGYALANAIAWTVTHRVLVRECRQAGIDVTYRNMHSEMAALAHFALPATLAGVAGMLAGWTSTLIIVRRPGGFSEMASLSIAGTLRGAVLFAPAVITRVSAPALAGLVGSGADDRHRRALRGSTLLAGASAAAVAAPIALAAPWLVHLFGAGFQGSGIVVAVMAVSGVIESVGAALNQQFLSRSRMWWNLFMVTGRGVVLVGATWALVPGTGALGAAWAVLLSYGLAVAFVIGFISRTEPAPTAK